MERNQGEVALMEPPVTCPKCGVSLVGDEIPVESQEAFGHTHFSRAIGIYSTERDRTIAWKCPDCGHEWVREKT